MSDWKNIQYKDGKFQTSTGGGGGSSTFAGLDDVNFSDLQNGQVPKYNSETHKWENADESGGGGTVTDVQVDGVSVVNQQGVAEITMPTPPSVPSELSDLSDVQFNNLIDHQPLRYNATSQKWVNGADNYPPLIYSDEEREIGVWRDGKPLYQKTKVFSNISKSGSLSFGVTNAETVFVCDIGKGTVDIPLPYVHGSAPSNNIGGFLVTSANDVTWEFRSGNDAPSTLSGFMTIRYTKTTDTAGSGTWTTQGGYAHHYSTTEQVVGTWIDGKPLYEKTYTNLSVSCSRDTYTHSGIIISDIDSVVRVPVAIDSNKQSVGLEIGMYTANNELALYVTSNPVTLASFTIQYTKTTD